MEPKTIAWGPSALTGAHSASSGNQRIFSKYPNLKVKKLKAFLAICESGQNLSGKNGESIAVIMTLSS